MSKYQTIIYHKGAQCLLNSPGTSVPSTEYRAPTTTLKQTIEDFLFDGWSIVLLKEIDDIVIITGFKGY